MTDKRNTYQIFTPSGCLTLDALKRYQSKSLSTKELKQAKDHIGDCELCLDAIEGIGLLSDKDKLETIVSEINNNLKKGLQETETSSKPVTFLTQNKTIYFASAASIIILVGLFFYFQFFMNQPEQSRLSLHTFQVDEIPIPTDENDIIIEEYLEISKDINKIPKNRKPILTVPKKQEKKNSFEKGSKSIKENQYQPDLEKVRTTDSSTESLFSENTNSQSDSIEPIVNKSIDIASTQPIEYYISGVTISEEMDAGFGLESSINEKHEQGNVVLNSQLPPNFSDKQPKKSNNTRSTPEKNRSEKHFFEVVSQSPEFPGGQNGLFNYLKENLKYPATAKTLKIQGSVLVSFIVEENGEISSVKALHGIGGGCNEEAIRVIAEMPPWKPAIKDGKGERVLFKMPIVFRLY